MKLSNHQLEKMSGYFLDISKVLIGAILVGVFVPEKITGLNLPLALGGTGVAILLFYFGLKIVPKI